MYKRQVRVGDAVAARLRRATSHHDEHARAAAAGERSRLARRAAAARHEGAAARIQAARRAQLARRARAASGRPPPIATSTRALDAITEMLAKSAAAIVLQAAARGMLARHHERDHVRRSGDRLHAVRARKARGRAGGASGAHHAKPSSPTAGRASPTAGRASPTHGKASPTLGKASPTHGHGHHLHHHAQQHQQQHHHQHHDEHGGVGVKARACLLYTSPSPRD